MNFIWTEIIVQNDEVRCKKCHLVLQYFAPKWPQTDAGTFQKMLRRSIPTDPL